MPAQKTRDQKGDWIRVAPCLYRYQNTGAYYAVLRRAGKLIRKTLKTTKLEVAKRKLRDFQNEQENAAPDAYKVRLDEYMAWRTFSPGERGPRRPSSDTDKLPTT